MASETNNMTGTSNITIVRAALAGITGAAPVDLAPAPLPEWLENDCYVLLTEPNREMTAQANLVMRGIPFYLPTIFRAARLSRRSHAMGADRPDIPMPLFPRTLFMAEGTLKRFYHLIPNIPGMLSRPLMKFGEQFAMLRPIGMQTIRHIELDERDRYMRRRRRANMPAYLPKIGEQVAVLVDEVLGGARGKVEAIDGKGRITILTEIMKRTVRVKLTADQIEPV